MVPLLGQLRRRRSDEERAMREGSGGQMERGGQPVLPQCRQETFSHPTVQPAALCPLGVDPLGAGE